MPRYTDSFKYKMITEICKGATITDLSQKYNVASASIMHWLDFFIEMGQFETYELDGAGTAEKQKLRQFAIERRASFKRYGTSTSDNFQWVTELDPTLREWAALAEEWAHTIIRTKNPKINAMTKFFRKYLIPYDIPRSVSLFLSTNYTAPDFYKILFSERNNSHYAYVWGQYIIDFIDWILKTKYSDEDKFGISTIRANYYNPLTQYLPEPQKQNVKSESDKNVLPMRYIKKLRNIICPQNSTSFADWKIVQNCLEKDWYYVDPTLIDTTDPDCVYKIKNGEYKLWFPGRAVALLTKLLIPLRTYQVRMLDSGEMDTYKYLQPFKTTVGKWILNDSPLAQGNPTDLYERGVFRRFNDALTHVEMTGLFINTNKTHQIHNKGKDPGYEIPWQYEEVLFWLAKLRDWQEKYNPISEPTRWTDLEPRHIAHFKDQRILKQYGVSTFLFRSPLETGGPSCFPIQDKSLEMLWYRVLDQLESDLHANGSENEKDLRFINHSSTRTTYYPLHSLRVSLITAYALDGGVPMSILSKAIAGHSRLIMTLYYTKMGISYVTETMGAAEKSISKKEANAFNRFLKDATYNQLELNTAVNSIDAYNAVLNGQQTGANFVIHDKGICCKSYIGCETGGIYPCKDKDGVTYGPVPGFPEKNCIRCRWFITGPAFLPSLVFYFNSIGYQMGEVGKRLIQHQELIEQLEDEKYQRECNGELFTKHDELHEYENIYEKELQHNDKLANDYNATLRLIDKCKKILEETSSASKDCVKLVSVGNIADVKIALREVTHELEQIQAVCDGAELFPEIDASKATLQRSQIIDLTLLANGKQPIMLTLSPEDQLKAGNQFMKLLIKRAGTFKDALPYALGRKKLAEIGIASDSDELFERIQLPNYSVVKELPETTELTNDDT